MENKLRRMENNLVISGTGLLAFTAWIIIRALLFVYTYREDVMELIRQEGDWDGEDMPLPLMLGLFAIIFLVVMLPYLYVAMCSRAEGLRKKSRKVYIVLALIMLIPQASTAIYSVMDVFLSDETFDAVVTAAIDITVLCVLVETVTTAIRVKKYRKEIGIELPKKPGKKPGKEKAR